jgi:hypothetical protein
VAEGLIGTLQGKRKTYILDIPIPLEVRLLVRMLDDMHAHPFVVRGDPPVRSHVASTRHALTSPGTLGEGGCERERERERITHIMQSARDRKEGSEARATGKKEARATGRK